MNDFTKDELEYIRNYVFNGAASISVEKHEILRDKIQSLIDNYCEHTEEYEDFNYQPMRCKACLEITG